MELFKNYFTNFLGKNLEIIKILEILRRINFDMYNSEIV